MDINKEVDGLLSFYGMYPVPAIKKLLGHEAKAVEPLVVVSPMGEYQLTEWEEGQLWLNGLRRYYAQRIWKMRARARTDEEE